MMNAFCESVNFDAFIAVVLRPARRITPQNSSPDRGRFLGADQPEETDDEA
jgi:hypothetical protein